MGGNRRGQGPAAQAGVLTALEPRGTDPDGALTAGEYGELTARVGVLTRD
jgi:hypothetical protein